MNDKKQQFILLRADGMSFDKIAKELNTSKPTLIQWSKLLEDEIEDIQFHSFLAIKETYKHNQKSKYEKLLKQLDKIDEGINEADLTTTNIKDLFTIKNNLNMQIDSIEKKVEVNPKITITNEYDMKEQLTLNLYEIQ